MPDGRHLLPLLERGSVGSLGALDLLELGIAAVAVDVLELALAPGLAGAEELGGVAGLTGWTGPALAVARVAAGPPAVTGWRARALPWLLDGRAGRLRLRSPLDGSEVAVGLDELASAARRLGAVPSAQLERAGPVFSFWDKPTSQAPAGELVVSSLAASSAGSGLAWDGAAWTSVEHIAAATLAPDCPCPTCAIAQVDYIRHLSSQREITAEHLLARHNLYWMRVLVEEREPAPLAESARA